MAPIDEPSSFEPTPPSSEARSPRKAAASEPPAAPKLVNVTIDVAAGRVVGVEAADASGAPRELSNDEWARLRTDRPTLQQALEQAFEAGIACALGDGATPEEAPEAAESADDAELSRKLLQSLIRCSGAMRLMQRDVLDSAIVGTLIEQAAEYTAAPQAATH